MTSRKITIDNSVKYIPQCEQNPEKDSETNIKKNKSIRRKQNKKLSQNKGKFIKNITGEGFKIPNSKMNCYFKKTH